MLDHVFVESNVGQPFDSGPRWLLTHIAAKRLSVSERTVRHLAQKGVLNGQKRGKKLWEFREDIVEALRIMREARYAE